MTRTRLRLGLGALAPLLATCACGTRESSESVLDLVNLYEYADVACESVDLPFLISRPLLGHEGWVREETNAGGTMLWMQGATGSLQIPLASAANRVLRLRARSNPAYGPRLQALVSWNGEELARLRLGPDDKEFQLSVPASLQRPGENVLRVDSLERHPRQRRVLAVSSLLVGRPGDARGASIPGRSAKGIWLPPGASLAYYLRHDSRPWLRLQLRSGDTGAALLRAELSDGSRRVPVTRFALPSGRARLVQETLACEPGGVCRLEVANEGEGGAWVEELTLRVERRPRPASVSLPGRPNVVLFLVDALRADFLGAYGHPAPTSPRFDSFAREAILFEDASAVASWTRPAVASLLTGLGAESHGVGGLHNALVPEITTLAETLGAQGYRTGAFVANGVVSPALGFDQGFETWNGGRRLYRKPAASIVDAALTWIGEQREPFFVYVHTLDPHRPYRPEAPHWAPFLFDGYRGSRDLKELLRKQELEPNELRFLRSAYQGEIRQNDAAFGAFLDGLKERGLLERSLVAFTADHGEEFFDHGGHGHSGTLYREALHIPLAFRIPGAARGARERAPVQQIDVAPTLLALVGARAPQEIEGRDLSARCLGIAALEEPVILISRLSYGAADKLAARLGPMKLIVNQEKGRSPESRLELYDLEHDPGETSNLAATRPLVSRYLFGQAAQARAAAATLRARLKAGREVPMTPEQEEQLRALGYIH